jgi:hypothetical protein
MRLSISLAFVSLILIALVARQGFAQLDPSDVAGAWLFDEGSGNVAMDLSDNGNHGTLVSDPAYVPGVRGTAVNLDGPASMRSATNGFPIGSDDRTLAFWVKAPSYKFGDTWLAGWGAPDTAMVSAMVLGLNRNAGGVLGFWGWAADVPSTTVLPDGEWVHAAFTYDSSSSEITIYLNGDVDAQTTIPTLNTPAGTDFNVAKGIIFAPLNAVFDEVVVLTTAASQAEVRSLMAGNIPGGPVGVPALPHWALIAMPTLLALAGALVLGRRLKLSSRSQGSAA